MVAAVHYFATIADQDALLDYLGEPDNVALAPWPIVSDPLVPLDRSAALTGDSVMIVNPALGAPVLIRPGDAALGEPTRAGLFNRLNWERLQPGSAEALVDSNVSPALFWQPGTASDYAITLSELGSQADAMDAISADYARWVNRAMNWEKGARGIGRSG